jgi:multiple sugar transport system permease protein
LPYNLGEIDFGRHVRRASQAPRRRQYRNEALLGWVFTAPAILPLLLFFLIPSLIVVGISLYDWNLIDNHATFVGTANYTELVHDRHWWKALRQTVYFALLTVPTTTVLGFLLGWALYRRLRPGHILETVIFSPYVLPPVATALTWESIFHARYGVLNSLLGHLGVGPIDWLGDPAWIIPSMALTTVWHTAGFSLVLYLSSFGRIPREIFEAAAFDGAGTTRTLFSIVLPLVSPTTYLILIFQTAAALKVFVVSSIFTAGTGGTDLSGMTVSLYEYQLVFVDFRAGYGAAVSGVLTVIILAVLSIGAALGQRRLFYR